MRLKLIKTLFILILNLTCNGQGVEVLYNKIKTTESKDSLLRYYTLLCSEYKHVNKDSSLRYGKKSILLTKYSKNAQLIGEAYFIYANFINDINSDSMAIVYYSFAESFFKIAKNYKRLGYVYDGLGNYWQFHNNNVLANQNYLKGISCFEKIENYRLANFEKLQVINNYLNFNELKKGKALCYELMQDSMFMSDKSNKPFLYQALGTALRDSSLEVSCVFFKKALNCYNLKNKEDINLKKFKIINIYLALIENYRDLSFQNNKLYTKESSYYVKAAQDFCSQNNISIDFPNYYYLLANYYLTINKYDSCIYYSHISLQLNKSKKFNIKHYNLDAYKNLEKAFVKKGNFDSAYFYLNLSSITSEEINNDNIKRKIFETEANYKVEKKEAEIQSLKKENFFKEQLQLAQLKKNRLLLIIAFAIVILLSVFFYFMYKINKQKSQFKLEQIEKERIKTTLHLLKNQISPHSMFNSLNNIYFKIDEDTESAKNMTLLFADLLRYQLYECNVDFIKLDKELNYIKQYIELQKIRLSNRCHLTVEISNEQADLQIAPLLFINLIENAFKYLTNDKDAGNYVSIILHTTKNEINLTVSNTYYELPNEEKNKKVGGIGLTNLQSRLKMIYPNKHILQIKKTGNIYQATLIIYVT